jgi:signal recognition particle subunit SRP54
MMDEISRVHKAIQPHETLFVVDAMTGQDAVNTAKAFNDILNFDGVILTKLDGDSGGAAISIKTVVNKPIKFVGTGEKMEALDVFYPIQEGNFGMGDVVFSREHKNSLMKKKLEEFKIAKKRIWF